MRGLFKGKKGIWRDFLIAMILGLVVVGLLTVYLFPEFFNQDTLDLETCRQSILIRANVPEVSKYGTTFASLKSKFPLKCKTEVIELNREDVELKNNGDVIYREADKKIGDAMAGCWALFDNGDISVFSADTVGLSSYCVPCARIHLSEDAKKALGRDSLDILKILRTTSFRGVNYMSYLTESGKDFSAFNPGFGREFNLEGEKFLIEPIYGTVRLKTRTEVDGESVYMNKINLPKYFSSSGGDLLIAYGVVVTPGPHHVPYLFYLDSNDIGLTNGKFIQLTFFKAIQNPLNLIDTIYSDITGEKVPYIANFCDNWDGIPA